MINTVKDMLSLMEKEYSDDYAFQYFEKNELVKVTYKQYVDDINCFASYLCNKFSDIEGKRIAILSKNSYHFMVCYLGTILSKAVIVPMNKLESDEILDYELDLADVSCIFSDEEFEIFRPDTVKRYEKILFRIDDYKNYTGKIGDFECSTDPDSLSAIIMTSGTTGKNKGVMLSQRNMFTTLESFTGQIDFIMNKLKKKQLQSFIVVPMFHTAGLATILAGNLKGNFEGLCNSPKYIFRDLAIMKSDYTFVVPAMMKIWYKDLKKGITDKMGGLTTVFTGAAPADPDVFKVFVDNGITIIQIYGLTEDFGGGTINNSDECEKIDSIGVVKYRGDIKIEDGEICFKSDAVMKGYVKDPKGTAEAIVDGWLHTGDLGYIDDDGCVYISGRKKNLIILSGGENVNPEELEALLQRNEKVTEVIVKQKGDKICAEVFCEVDDQQNIKEYINTVNKTLPGYKKMTIVEFRDTPFTKTGVGKIVR